MTSLTGSNPNVVDMADLPSSAPPAPELDVSEWLGEASPLESLRGRFGDFALEPQ